MNKFIYSVGFHRSGKPRQWLSFLLFRKDHDVRPIFYRIVHKKSGRVRPRFAHWVKGAPSGPVAHVATAEVTVCSQGERFLQSLLPLEEVVAQWRGRKDPTVLLTADAIQAQIMAGPGGSEGRLVISVSHDNYRQSQGGVQFCIQREETLAAERGSDYLQIHPWHPIPRLAHTNECADTIVGLVLNGHLIGAAPTSAVITAVGNLTRDGHRQANLVIHHLLGHLPEQISELARATGSSRCILWLHDFFTICPSYTLQRNGLSFCNAPPVTSNACNLCAFGQERVNHQRRMATFFAEVQVDIASPSRVTADLWKSKSGLTPASITEIPHVALDPVDRGVPLLAAQENKIRVGYLGDQVQHKGWTDFTGLLQDTDRSPGLQFVVLSRKRPLLGEDEWINVSVTAEHPNAMAEAVAAADLDIVLHWPAWPETFSFTTFEALAGGAYVVTNPWSGNVADAVRTSGNGVILADNASLLDFARGEGIKKLVDARRARTRQIELRPRHSDLSFTLLERT